jgi:transcriptional regulator with XRE-family HTH domain
MPTHEPIDQALAGALRRLRRARGSTQEHVAFAAGITVAALARIERGQAGPQWTTVRRIVGALEVSLGELAVEVEGAGPPIRSASGRRRPSPL